MKGTIFFFIELCSFSLAWEQAPPPPDAAFVCFRPTLTSLLFPFSSWCAQRTPLSTYDRCSKRCSLQEEVRVVSLFQTLGSHWPFLRFWEHSRLWLVAFHFCLVFWAELSPVVLFRGESVHQGGLHAHCAPRPGSGRTGTFLPVLRACGLLVMLWYGIPLPLSSGFLLELSVTWSCLPRHVASDLHL